MSPDRWTNKNPWTKPHINTIIIFQNVTMINFKLFSAFQEFNDMGDVPNTNK